MTTEHPPTPSEEEKEEVREGYITGMIRDGEGADWDEFREGAGDYFDHFIARVRRDAAREALDGLEEFIRTDMDEPHGDRAASRVWGFRDTHYPEEKP